jgi:SOS response regulatory protein OraA/RecX
MLARRSLSEGEVALRLEGKGFPPPEAAGTVARLRELGLLDDGGLCRQLARSCQEVRRYGPAKIARYLLGRRFPWSLVESALREVAPAAAVAEAAAAALRKRFPGGIPPGRDGAAKAYRFLAGRGFPPETCRSAVGRPATDTPEGVD